MLNAINLLLSDSRGVYIPRDFVTDQYGNICEDTCNKWNITHDDAEILAQGPDDEYYWDTWEDVLNNAECEIDGYTYRLHQDGNLWAICYSRMSLEERINFDMDTDAPDGWTTFIIGSQFICPLYYGDNSGLEGDEIEALEHFVKYNGDKIGDSYDAGFDTCEITGMNGDCCYAWIKDKEQTK